MDMAHKILEVLFIMGHVEEAIGRINLMLENGCLPDLDKLLVSLCENDRVIEAHKLVLEALYTEENTLPAYSMLCKIKNKGGAVDQKVCDALMESLKVGGCSKQADILSRILVDNASLTSKRGKRAAMGV
ncbi:hypothetical protein ABZP36_008355 [Zizania latifolia]